MMRKLLAAALAFFISASAIVFGGGVTATGEAELYYSGKSEIAVDVQSDKNEEEFGEIVNEYIRQYRYIDKALLVEAKKIEKIEGGYKVIAKTRRIDKVKGVGQFELEAFNRYAADGSQTKWNLEYWAGQDYKITRRVYFDSVSSSVSLSSKAGKKYYCTPKTAAGDDVDLDTFCAFGENSKDRVRILTFCLFLSDAVTSVRVKLPGVISHYAGDAVVLDGENGFILQPKKNRRASYFKRRYGRSVRVCGDRLRGVRSPLFARGARVYHSRRCGGDRADCGDCYRALSRGT